MPTLEVDEPLRIVGVVPPRFSAYGPYAFDKAAAAPPPAAATPRRVTCELLKNGVSVVAEHDCDITHCDGTRWFTTLEKSPPLANGSDYKLIVKLYEANVAAPIKVTDCTPFTIDSTVEQRLTLACSVTDVGDSGGDSGNLRAMADRKTKTRILDLAYEFLRHWNHRIKSAVCVVFQVAPPRTILTSVTPADLGMGRCTATIPVPTDIDVKLYATQFLLLDGMGRVVHASPPQGFPH
jgi:hypothetical protein